MRGIIMKLTVPFCVKRCDYCQRPIVEGWDTTRAHTYMVAVQQEIEANADQFEDCRVRAIHWGGGLASMANAQDVSDTMRLIRSRYSVAPNAPITMRSAIANISGASMPFLKRAGITRFDFEMMSLFPLGYSHVNQRDSLGDLPVVCDYFLRSYTHDNLGIILLFGYAQAEPDNFRRSVVEFTRTTASHLILQPAEGAGAMSFGDAKAQVEDVRPLLENAGFVEYLPLRFARPGKEDQFARMEAAGAECIGFGLGASTRVDGVESKNTDSLERYCASSADFAAITVDVRPLSMAMG